MGEDIAENLKDITHQELSVDVDTRVVDSGLQVFLEQRVAMTATGRQADKQTDITSLSLTYTRAHIAYS